MNKFIQTLRHLFTARRRLALSVSSSANLSEYFPTFSNPSKLLRPLNSILLSVKTETARRSSSFSMPFKDTFSGFGSKKPPKKELGKSSKKAQKKRPALIRFTNQDQILFTKRLSMILRSGMPIMEGLHILAEETRSASSAYIYESLIIDVSNGQPLSTGLARFHRAFGEFSINIIKVGEASGTLHENLEYLSEELKKKQVLKRQVFGALVYPAVIVAATIGITVMLTVFIFPKIIPIFQSVKATLPWSTRALIVISNFLSHHGIALFFSIVAAIIAFIASMRLFPRFHLIMDHVLLRIPLLGKLSKYYNLANICRTTSILLRSDVRIVQAIELVAASTKNLAYRNELLTAKERIINGQKISTQFGANKTLFPTMLAQMVTVGESTGNLGGTLMYLSGMYEEDINELTKNLTTLLEPILMIVMGLVVGFIAISIISPIYSITSSLNPH